MVGIELELILSLRNGIGMGIELFSGDRIGTGIEKSELFPALHDLPIPTTHWSYVSLVQQPTSLTANFTGSTYRTISVVNSHRIVIISHNPV